MIIDELYEYMLKDKARMTNYGDTTNIQLASRKPGKTYITRRLLKRFNYEKVNYDMKQTFQLDNKYDFGLERLL